MDDVAYALDAAVHGHHAGRENDPPLLREDGRPDNEIGDAALILKGDENHALGGTGHLAHQHDSGGLHPSAIVPLHRFSAGDDALSAQVFAQEGDGVMAQRQPDMAVILDDLAAGRHRLQCNSRLVKLGHGLPLAGGGRGEQRQWRIAQPLDGPQRLASRKFQRWPEGIGLGKPHQSGDRDAGTPPQIVDRDKRPISSRPDDRIGIAIGKTLDHAQAKPNREAPLTPLSRMGSVIAYSAPGASPSPQSKSSVADFDPSVDGPKPAYTRFRLGEGWGGGSCRGGTTVLHSSTPTPDPSPQGGGEQRQHRIMCDHPGM